MNSDGTVRACWEHFRAQCVPKDAPPGQVETAFLAFYGGAAAAFYAVMQHLEEYDIIDTLKEDDYFAGIHSELERFTRESPD